MDKKIKHLEFIQQVISRMNSNSFLVKGWAITLMAAVFAISTTNDKIHIHFINYFIILMFWIVDGYYLSQERKYRALYDLVRQQKESEIDFNMDTKSFNENKYSLSKAALSSPTIFLYIFLIIVSLSILYFIKNG